MEEGKRVRADDLRAFVVRMMCAVGVPVEDAATVADVLVMADLRGVDSHGVARLRRYVSGVQKGLINGQPNIRVVYESPCSATLEGNNGLGQVIGRRAMEMAIEKARSGGVGVVVAGNSNHYGIAGYYPLMALQHDLIGCSMTNARSVVVPTFSRGRWLGTNPISVGIPAGQEWPFLLDMSTSVVPEGKIEVAARLGKPLPVGWAIDADNQPVTDAAVALELCQADWDGGLLPLGGAGEALGGHKGYGLGLMVDILCGVLGSAAYGRQIPPSTSHNLGQFFAAMRVDLFRPLHEFKASMDKMIREIKALPKAEGQARIYIHGEKEFEEAKERRKSGIPLHPRVLADLQQLAAEVKVEFDL